jgi:hypothetical protein
MPSPSASAIVSTSTCSSSVGGDVYFACDDGLVISSFAFADFGQPYGVPGTCNSYAPNPYCTTGGLAANLTSQCAGQSSCVVSVTTPPFQPLDAIDGDGPCTLQPYLYYQLNCGLPAEPADIVSTNGFETTAGGSLAYLVCSAGAVITNVTFVSYGTPGGSPDSPATWTDDSQCSSASALARVSARCVGLTGCGFNAIDDELGVPSGGCVDLPSLACLRRRVSPAVATHQPRTVTSCPHETEERVDEQTDACAESP